MSIAQTLALPDQPALGDVNLVPLGGDGFTAPHSSYHVNTFEVEGDATGGTVTQTIRMDPRYVSLISYATLRMTQVNDTDEIVRFTISGGGFMPRVGCTRTLEHDPHLSTFEIFDTWVPAPVLAPGAGRTTSLSVICDNNVNNLYFVDALVYLFDIRVREMTPMGPLLWARGVGDGV